MKVPVRTPDLGARQRKALLLGVLGLSAIAASGEGYRRRRQSDSSDMAKKGLVLILAMIAIGALLGAGARRRRANVAPELAVADDASSSETDEGADSEAQQAAATTADGRG